MCFKWSSLDAWKIYCDQDARYINATIQNLEFDQFLWLDSSTTRFPIWTSWNSVKRLCKYFPFCIRATVYRRNNFLSNSFRKISLRPRSLENLNSLFLDLPKPWCSRKYLTCVILKVKLSEVVLIWIVIWTAWSSQNWFIMFFAMEFLQLDSFTLIPKHLSQSPNWGVANILRLFARIPFCLRESAISI